MSFFYLTLVPLFVLIFCFFWLSKIAFVLDTQDSPKFLFSSPFVAFYILLAVSFVGLYNFISGFDILTPLSLSQVFVPLSVCGLLLVFPNWIAAIVGVAITVFFIPNEAVDYYIAMPFWLNKLIVFVVILFFTLSYKFSNAVVGCSFIQSMFVGLGMFVLMFLHATPVLYACWGLVLFALSFALFLFNRDPARINVETREIDILGFVVVWVSLLCAAEGLLVPILILNSIFIFNTLQALLKKITPFKSFADIYQNTFYAQSVEQNIMPQDIYSFLTRAHISLVLLACMSLYTDSFVAILLFVFILAGWFMYRLLHLYEPRATLRSVYSEIKSKVKDSLDAK